jgi:A/G-specific adenine glycosylase
VVTLNQRKITALVLKLLYWFAQNARDLPWRRTRDPYAIWVSEIMLQQTQVKTVIPYWKRWMRELPTIQATAKASPAKIHKLWEGLGYYARVRNLQKAAKQIIAQQNAHLNTCRRRGDESQIKKKSETPSAFARLRRDKCVVSYKFPDNFDDVLALPGIGRYTAGAICSIAFNQPVPVLDGNVIRVLTRIFGIRENPQKNKTNAMLWRLAEELVARASAFAALRRDKSRITHHASPTKSRTRTRTKDEDDSTASHFNQSLMELGALVCTPRQPQCQNCPVKKLCVAFCEDRVEELPNLGKRTAATARRYIAFVIERGGKLLVRQRPAGVVNAHLWEFPNVEIGARLSGPPHEHFGARWQSAVATPLFDCGHSIQSGVALRFPPQSKKIGSPLRHVLGVAAKLFGSRPTNVNHLCTVKHSITRYRITLEAWRVKFRGSDSARPQIFKMGRRGPSSAVALLRRVETSPSENNGVWLTPAKLDTLAFTSAHRKILERLSLEHRLTSR